MLQLIGSGVFRKTAPRLVAARNARQDFLRLLAVAQHIFLVQ